MANEIAKPQDATPEVTAERQSNAPLHKEAVVELSSKSKAPQNTPDQSVPVKQLEAASTDKPTNKVEPLKSEAAKPVDNFAPPSSTRTLQADKSVAPKLDDTNRKSTPEVAEKGKLTAEMKQAVDSSSKVIVKIHANDGDNSDLVIKSDGTIVQKLNMDPKASTKGHLTVGVESEGAIEKGSAAKKLTEAQAAALREVMAYVNSKNKDFSVEMPPPVKQDQPKAELKSVTQPEVSNEKLTPPASEARYTQPGRRGYSNPGSFAPSYEASPGSNMVENIYSAPAPIDFSQVDLSELLMEWFSADPEKFKKLMPELYKKIAGADGKIDPKKLSQLQNANEPLLENLKTQLPSLANEFPATKALSGGAVSTSGDAINPTGAKLAEKAAQVSDELPGSGYCAKGVSLAIERATGKTIFGNANDMRETLPGNGFKEASSKELKVGQVVHVYWTPEVYAQEQARRGPCPNYGDIAVIGKGKDGQLLAINDNSMPLNDYLAKSRYDWNTLKVFNPPRSLI